MNVTADNLRLARRSSSGCGNRPAPGKETSNLETDSPAKRIDT